MRRPRVSRAGLLLAGAALAASCGRAGDGEAPEALLRLADSLLARPGGDWLFCARFELTREEWSGEVPAGERDLPAVMISAQEVAAWAAERGLRLPTPAEWRALAGGPPTVGAEPAATRNTLELQLGRALPVGVFEGGRSPHGGYDFYGNVRELAGPAEDGRWFALGGSFATRAAGGDAREGVLVEAGDRAEDLGARWVADAVPYLRERVLPLWRERPQTVARGLAAAAARWRADARAGLAEQLRLEGFPAEFVALLQP